MCHMTEISSGLQKRKKPDQEAEEYTDRDDQPGFELKFINSFIGELHGKLLSLDQ